MVCIRVELCLPLQSSYVYLFSLSSSVRVTNCKAFWTRKCFVQTLLCSINASAAVSAGLFPGFKHVPAPTRRLASLTFLNKNSVRIVGAVQCRLSSQYSSDHSSNVFSPGGYWWGAPACLRNARLTALHLQGYSGSGCRAF